MARLETAVQLLVDHGLPGERLQELLSCLDERGVYVDVWSRVPSHPAYVAYASGRVVSAPRGDPRTGKVLAAHEKKGELCVQLSQIDVSHVDPSRMDQSD